MKCKYCGGERFYAHRRVRMEVVCNGDMAYEDVVTPVNPLSDIYDTEECYGPFQCLGCGAEYENLNDGEEPIAGPEEGWEPAVPFKKVKDRLRNDGSRFQVWEGERYIVTINFYGPFPYVQTRIKEEMPGYLPHIYIRDRDDMPEDVEIQTTSYGALSATEFNKFLEAMKLARIDSEDIYRFFVRPLRENTFVMGEFM